MNQIFRYENDPVRFAELLSAHLQTMPEHSFEEVMTTACIKEVGQIFGLEPIDLGMKTGAVFYLDVKADDCVALRADIDAVPAGDRAEHICGHYGHTATVLGVMAYFCSNPHLLKHNVLFIFQPAEECTAGADAMMRAGIFEKVPMKPARIFGIHNRPELPVGVVAVHEGPLMSEKTNWVLTVTGKSGHGGEPHKCIDPMPAAAAWITGAHTIVSRNLDPNEAAVCSVLSMHCGTPENFVPEEAVLTGTIRASRHEDHDRMWERLNDLSRGIARAYECTIRLNPTLHVPPVVNDAEMTKIALTAASHLEDVQVCDTKPALGSDDYAVFMESVPGFYYWVGSGKEDGSSPAWHKHDFKLEDGYQSVAVPLLINSVLCS